MTEQKPDHNFSPGGERGQGPPVRTGAGGSARAPRNTAVFLLLLFTILFAVELAIMVGIDELFDTQLDVAHHFLAAAVLALVAVPSIYFFSYRGLLRSVEKREKAERDLRLAVDRAVSEEGRTRAILDAIGDGISIQDRQFRVLYQNAAHQRFFGDRTGEFCYRAYERNDRVCDGCGIDRAFGDGQSHTVIRSAVVEGQGKVYAEITSSPLRDGSGAIVAGIEVARDITERMHAEESARRHLDRETALNAVLNQSISYAPLPEILQGTLEHILSFPWISLVQRGGIFLTDADGNLVLKAQKDLNSSVLEQCATVRPGWCLCGRTIESKEIVFADRLDDRHDYHYEGMAPHGHYCVPILFAGECVGVFVLYLEEGHRRSEQEEEFLRAVANVLAGIIQRKRMEEEREQLIEGLEKLVRQVTRAEQEWQDTFDSIKDPIYLSGRDLGIVRANRAFYDFFGLDPLKSLGRKCYEILYGMDSPPPGCPHVKVLATGEPETKEMPSPDGRRTLLVAVFPYFLRDGRPQGTICIMRDITEKKEQDRRLAVSERFAGLGQMASGIAHEINNPLSAISGAAEGMQLRIETGRFDPEFFRRYLGIIREEVFRCKSITTAMLSFVRKAPIEKKSTDVNRLLDRGLDSVDLQDRLRGVEVRRSYGEGLPAVLVSEGDIRQVFSIIINNAVDAMAGSGTLTLESGVRNGSVLVRISDTGQGINDEHRDRIFDPFFTTKQSSGGTGLGLSIARKIIANHGGSIEVSSVPDHGAAFTITLPAAGD